MFFLWFLWINLSNAKKPPQTKLTTSWFFSHVYYQKMRLSVVREGYQLFCARFWGSNCWSYPIDRIKDQLISKCNGCPKLSHLLLNAYCVCSTHICKVISFISVLSFTSVILCFMLLLLNPIEFVIGYFHVLPECYQVPYKLQNCVMNSFFRKINCIIQRRQ